MDARDSATGAAKVIQSVGTAPPACHPGTRTDPTLHDCGLSAPEMPPLLVELDQDELQLVARSVPGGFHNIQDIYPLTALQEGMLFHHAVRGAGDTYVVLTLLECQSAETISTLAGALQFAIDRHDTLRTAIVWLGLPRPVQVVYRTSRLDLEQLALDPDRDCRKQMMERMRPELHRLDLGRAPLVRMQVASDPRNGGPSYALLVLHHLVCDAISLETLIAEITTRIKAPHLQLPAATQFRDHVVRTLAQAGTRGAESFFSRALSDFSKPSVPFGRQHMHGSEYVIHEFQLKLAIAVGNRLRVEARRLRVSTAAILHVACGLVVSHTSQLDDVVFGTVFSGRLRSGASAKDTVGMFINTLPLRLRLAGLSCVDAVSQTHRQLLELMGHEQVDLTVVHQCSGVSGATPLFSVLLNYIRRPRRDDTGWSDAETGISMVANYAWTNYPFTFIVEDSSDEFVLVHQTQRTGDLSRMLTYFVRATESLVEALESDPRREVLTLPVLPESDRSLVIGECSRAAAEATAETSAAACRPGADGSVYEPPQGVTEQGLAAIWAETLKLDRVGRNQSFFALGGHSLLGFQLLLKVSERFNIQAPAISIFRCPTVKQMARFIEGLNDAARSPPDSNETDIEEGVI